MPQVTVLLATHNGTRYLAQALQSVLAQTFSDFELIIVDDASTEKVKPILNAYHDSRVRIVHNSRRLGLTKSLNRGLVEAQGDIIARIDDDDVWLDSSKLTKQIARFSQEPKLGLCGTQHHLIDEAGQHRFTLPLAQTDQAIRTVLLRSNQFAHSAVCFPRRVIDDVGGYDETIRYAQDYELWLRIGTKYQLANLPDLTVAKRIHTQAVSYQHQLAQCLSAAQTAYRYRHQYPGFYASTGVYSRELLINTVFPKRLTHRLTAWRQALTA